MSEAPRDPVSEVDTGAYLSLKVGMEMRCVIVRSHISSLRRPGSPRPVAPPAPVLLASPARTNGASGHRRSLSSLARPKFLLAYKYHPVRILISNK